MKRITLTFTKKERVYILDPGQLQLLPAEIQAIGEQSIYAVGHALQMLYSLDELHLAPSFSEDTATLLINQLW